MPIIEVNSELKSALLFSAAGIVIGGVSSVLGSAYISGAVGIAALVGLRKLAMKIFGMDAAAMMQFGIMPYLTFWYAVWVVLVNI